MDRNKGESVMRSIMFLVCCVGFLVSAETITVDKYEFQKVFKEYINTMKHKHNLEISAIQKGHRVEMDTMQILHQQEVESLKKRIKKLENNR
jgi:23S rRNA pseudoU1915 N3-methylase RlmH